MIASRRAVDVRPFDRVTVPVGPVVHVGEVLNVHPGDGLPQQVVVVLDCRLVCRHCDAIHFLPGALVTTDPPDSAHHTRSAAAHTRLRTTLN